MQSIIATLRLSIKKGGWGGILPPLLFFYRSFVHPLFNIASPTKSQQYVHMFITGTLPSASGAIRSMLWNASLSMSMHRLQTEQSIMVGGVSSSSSSSLSSLFGHPHFVMSLLIVSPQCPHTHTRDLSNHPQSHSKSWRLLNWSSQSGHLGILWQWAQ
jgi:hypothetical protein